MKRLALFLSLATVTAFSASQIAVSAPGPEPTTTESQTAVIHISHSTDDLHRCFMGLKLATMLQKAEANVTLFLDIEGVRLADKRLPLNLTWGPSPTPLSEYYDHFVDAGGKVVVCPHCAKVANLNESDLRTNASIGTPEQLTQMLLKADKIMDY